MSYSCPSLQCAHTVGKQSDVQPRTSPRACPPPFFKALRKLTSGIYCHVALPSSESPIALVPTVLVQQHFRIKNYDVHPSERSLYGLLFHRVRAMRDSFLLASRRYVDVFRYDRRDGSENLLYSLEYGHLLIHGVGRSWMSRPVHQLHYLEP
jgi:hypothetical protein